MFGQGLTAALSPLKKCAGCTKRFLTCQPPFFFSQGAITVKIDRAFSLKPNQDPKGVAEKQDKQLRDAAQLYEQHFMREMVKAMRQASPDGGLVEKSMGEKIFSEQLDNQYVENWSGRGGVGLADMIYTHVKERYFPEAQMAKPQGPLPLKPESTGAIKGEWKMKPLPLTPPTMPDSVKNDIKMRFEGQDLPESGRQVQAPWSGKISKAFTAENGVSMVEIEHDQGLVSRMVFPGALDGQKLGQDVAAGAKIGQVQGLGSAQWLQWQVGRG